MSEADLPTPELIAGRYRLVTRIGTGSMGIVWSARDELLDRTVAVKQLLPTAGLSEIAARQGTERAMREARITARLHHPHAVTVHDVVEHDGQPCLVMEYVPSRSLSKVLNERMPTPQEVARIGAQVAEALAAAHEVGIVHRDVKPDNVLLTEDGVAKITDFGISRAVGDGSLTAPGIVVGTPAYLAPEVAGGATAGFASDVFSLGATLYQAIEGEPPFGFDQQENTIGLLLRVAEGLVPPPTQAGPLRDVLLWLLMREPEQRPSMAKAAEALAAVAAGRPAPVPPPTMIMPAVGAPRQRPRTLLASLAAVALLLSGILAGVLISGASHPNTPLAGQPPATTQSSTPVTTTMPTTTTPASSCVADYEVVNTWPGHFQAQVTVTNSSDLPLSGWSVVWTYAHGQDIAQVWSGALVQQGSMITVDSVSYNGSVDARKSTSFGFIGSGEPERPTLSCAGRP